MKSTIPVYIPNLEFRKDRRESVVAQFSGREEFEVHIVPAIKHSNGAWGLWQTFYQIVSLATEKKYPFFIFCEDDHIFSDNYDTEFLKESIKEADSLGADLLSGGMSWIDCPVQVTERLFWVKAFNGMQFTIIFKRFYHTILTFSNKKGYITDSFLSGLSDNIFVLYPYISTQADFGYSDVTSKNNIRGRVPSLFKNTLLQLEKLNKVRLFYQQFLFEDIFTIPDDLSLPTYIINLPNRIDRRESIKQQFSKYNVFEVLFIDACIDSHANVGLWKSICKIIKMAEQGDEEVILICEDDHIFTNDFRINFFLKQVWLAGMMGTDILSGGLGGFGNIVPVKSGLYWVDWLWCTQFIVIYRRAFSTILDASFKDTDVADEFLSRLLPNKLTIFPFISIQKEFGYSDVTQANNKPGIISCHFNRSKDKGNIYLRTLVKYGNLKNEDYALKVSLDFMPIKALHLGCGNNILKGWLNTDITTYDNISYLNAEHPFPIEDNSLDYIFSEHMFEHLTYESGKSMLQECYRTLKYGGVLRLTTPSLDFLMTLYHEPQKKKHQDYARWSLQQFAPQIYADFNNGDNELPMAFVINNFMHFWGHQMIYNYSLLYKMLEKSGFKNIKECPIGSSEHPYLCCLEHHGNVIPFWANEMESMAIEASKFA